ncbi:MAG: class I mannose-6-phosphate isomerase [Candidatus Omnitrophica bacterium]|nr:class I mannose-6-phosphate isomerase [Candidatus Omnitrophota bacterium]
MVDFSLLRLSPHLTPRPWGGVRLGSALHKPVPQGELIGESWELSDHPDGPSKIAGGPFDGKLFGDILRDHPREMIGRPVAPKKFPLLVKYIDAREDLSIQVHPDDEYNQRMGIEDRGKTECWFILDCAEGAEVIYGLREGTTRGDLERAIENKTVPDCIRRVPIVPGTFLFVPPGTVHAILGGTLLCEIQQSSNITFRLWDWDRKPERTLQIEPSLDVIRFENDTTPQPLHIDPPKGDEPDVLLLTDNPFFKVRAVRLPSETSLNLSGSGHGVIVNGVGGAASVNAEAIGYGETLFVPAAIPEFKVSAGDSPSILLLSESNE